MAKRFSAACALGCVLLVGLPAPISGQADPYNFPFNTGQDVAPFFDGWSRNRDGSFEMHFGYINRNYVEELHLSVGPTNVVDPGDADQGQPTFFYPRLHRKVFSVTVPADWGDRELVWTLTSRGKQQQAIAWLDPVWEIDPILNGRAPTEEQQLNQAPTLALQASSRTLTLPAPLTVTATLSDDGLPKQRSVRLRARGQETPPTLRPKPGDPKAPINVPALRAGSAPNVVKVDDRLSITWTVFRGPASIEVAAEPAEGDSVTMRATFTAPGDYVLRARLSDGHLVDVQDVAVTVNGPR